MGKDGETAQYDVFGGWLGEPVTYRVTFADAESWSGISAPYFLSMATKPWLASNPNRHEVLTVPLMPKSGNQGMLQDVADGHYDTYFETLAGHLATKTGAPERVIVRLGWELNGKWYPWSAVGYAEQYKQAYRQVVGVMRGRCNVLRFEWNLSRGADPKFDWTTAYPGDDVVDGVSMDVYDQYNSGWNSIVNGYQGLAFFRNFARQLKKPEAYPEWGLSTNAKAKGRGDDTAFVQGMYDWLQAGGADVPYAAYWNTPAGGPDAAIYSDSPNYSVKVPNSQALYKRLFGQS